MRALVPAILGAVVLLAGCAGGVATRPRTCPGPDGCGRIDPRPAEPALAADRRAVGVALDTLPLAPIPRAHPRVGRLHGRGSLSIGTATDGFVVDDARLPLRGPHHRVLDEHATRGMHCAVDELVAALTRAAAGVAKRHPGAVLPVGNLGRCGGGDVRWSVSHNSGRDADLGFYLKAPDGRQHLPRTLIPVDGNGIATDGEVRARFDPARNWRVVRELLTDRTIQVQWIFVSRGLRKRLLDHAAAVGEPPSLVARAAEVLAQPGRHRPHDDHFHVRIYCPKDDLYEGCRDTGTNRSWYRGDGGRADRRMAELGRLARSRDPEVRAAAATVLGRMGRPIAGPRLVRMLSDRDVRVARAAAAALGELGVAGVRDDVMRRIADHPDDQVAALLVASLGTLLPRARAQALGALLAVDRPLSGDLGVFQWSEPARVRALELLCLADRGRATDRLIEAIAQPGVDIAAIDARLRDLTGADPGESATADPAGAWAAWARQRATAP